MLKDRMTAGEFRKAIKQGKIDVSSKGKLISKEAVPGFDEAVKKPYNKYSAKKTEYDGFMFDSKKEAEYAMGLDFGIKAKHIISYEKQVRIRCEINGAKICDYIIDFIVKYPDRLEYVDVKGMQTPVFKLKKKLVEALHPDIRITLV